MYSPLKVGFIARFLISRRRRSEFDDDDASVVVSINAPDFTE